MYDEGLKEEFEKKFPNFLELSQKDFSHLWNRISWISFQKGETIFQQGAPGLGIYFLLRGEVKVSHRTQVGKKLTFKVAGPGDYLGLCTLFNKENYITYSKPTGKANVGFLERGEFVILLKNYPSLLFKFCKYLSTQMMAYQLKLVESSYSGSKQRISRLLAQSAKGDVDVSRSELAQMTGVTYKTVIQNIKEIERRGYITAENGKILIKDREKLSKIGFRFPIDFKKSKLL